MKYDTVSCYYFHFISDKSSRTGNFTFKYFYLHLIKATWPNKILLTSGVRGQFEWKVGALFILIKTITSEGDAGPFHTGVTVCLFWGLLYCLSVDFRVKGDEIWNCHNYMTRENSIRKHSLSSKMFIYTKKEPAHNRECPFLLTTFEWN